MFVHVSNNIMLISVTSVLSVFYFFFYETKYGIELSQYIMLFQIPHS